MRRSYQIWILAWVIISLLLAAYLVSHVDLPAWSPIAFGAGIVLLSMPSFWAAKMWLGWRDAVILFIVCGVYALVVETALTQSVYSSQLFAGYPSLVALAWTSLLLGAYSIAGSLLTASWARIVFSTITLVIFRSVLDPGVPAGMNDGLALSNFVGWIVSSSIGAVLVELLVLRFKPLLPVPVQLSASAFLIAVFGTALAAFSGFILTAVAGTLTLFGLAMVWRKFHYRFDDKIVLVDEDNQPVGTASKLAAHDSDTVLHRAFSVFIFNSKGELLLQQRARSKKTWPGVWSNSCCGHVMMHEAPSKAAARRLGFELGLTGVELEMALPDFRYRAEKDGIVENEICPVLVGFTNAVPVPNPSEVASIRWVNWNEFLASLSEPGNEISPWAIEEVQLLAKSKAFTEWLARRVPISGTNSAVC